MQAIHSRGRALRQTLVAWFALLASAAGLTLVVQVLLTALGSGSVDAGWLAVALLCASAAFWLRRSDWVLQLLAISSPAAHRARNRLVWTLLLFGFVLVAALKVGSADQHAYKKLVFGEGGLVEWSQVLFLATGIRAAWLLADDLRLRLKERWVPLLFRGLAAALGLLLLEELAWGQVIFGWRTPELMQEINAQNETTLHNIGWFQDRLDLGYFLVTLAVLAAVVLAPWLAARFRPRASAELAEVLRCIRPATYSWPLFLAVAVLAFFVATRAASGIVLNRDQEWGELLLYGSSLLYLLRARVLLGPTESVR